jgi:gamma-glutamyltranspeptidase/glutathione hydrolase
MHIASRRTRRLAAAGATTALVTSVTSVTGATTATAAVANAAGSRPHHHIHHYSVKTPTSVGYGGAVTSVDPEASRIGIRVLKRGGNAVDAAVATAAALGVTEPYSSGIGGGGFFVYYNARTGRIRTIDGRETAPRRMPHDAFIDPATGEPYNFTPELVTSGVSVGVPGTLATWHTALRRWGRTNLRKALAPAIRLADRGFVVDKTFHDQTVDNKKRFKAYTTTPKLFLRHGRAPAVGSVFRNHDLADTYRLIARKGPRVFYHGRLATEIARAVRNPPKSPKTGLPVMPGYMRAGDIHRYRTRVQAPTHVGYRGLDVYGMAPSSSGGSTVGESLNIMEQYDLASMDTGAALHHYLEATALAFADRGKYVGDRAFVHVPLHKLLSDTFAKERACNISETTAMTKPVPPGDVNTADGVCDSPSASTAQQRPDTENVETTNMTVADKWGNVVEYTLTIEQTGGSGMLLKHRGFLLNNELTDFSAVYDPTDPNRIEGGKRPRSSISPTIVLKNGKPYVALGSPGGSTIITTVTQLLLDYLDRGMTLPQAIADPRGSQRNTEAVSAEPAFIDKYGALLTPYGHELQPSGDKFTSAAEIGAATAIGFGRHGRLTAVSEPHRRGGGSALVVHPAH